MHKLKEAKSVFGGIDVEISHYPVDLVELQESSLKKIAVYSLEQLPSTDHEIFVEDTGLFIEGLSGFPGPYASYIFKTLGNEGIIKLMTNVEDRNAYFESFIAYRDLNGSIHSFSGRCNGKISKLIRGKQWGFDPIFIPSNSEFNPENKTFSELGDEPKNKISHRAIALENLKNFIF